MKPNKYGLVPLKMLKSSAANGVRKDEIRGFPPAVAEKLVAKKLAEVVEEKKSSKPTKSENNEQKPGGSPAGTTA